MTRKRVETRTREAAEGMVGGAAEAGEGGEAAEAAEGSTVTETDLNEKMDKEADGAAEVLIEAVPVVAAAAVAAASDETTKLQHRCGTPRGLSR